MIEGWEGRRVTLDGTLVYRGGMTMIEVVDGSVRQADGPIGPEVARKVLGTARLEGEIVDSKCYLGVMKPARQKVHKGCAVRCLSGGIPPLFRVPSGEGPPQHYLLVDSQGQSVNQRILNQVAVPLVIEGEVWQLGDLKVLAADPETYRNVG